MWAEQQTDGSFRWWSSFTLAPWENGESGSGAMRLPGRRRSRRHGGLHATCEMRISSSFS
jgi:hypothetical protein